MVSLIPTFFLCELPKKAAPSPRVVTEDAFLAFAIGSEEAFELSSFLQPIYALDPPPFCVALDLSGDTFLPAPGALNKLADDLASISFHRNYICTHPGYPLLLIKIAVPDLAEFEETITARMQLHGYDGVDILAYDMATARSSQPMQQRAHYLSAKENISDAYRDLLQNKIVANDVLLVALGEENGPIAAILEALDRVHIEFMNSFPRLFDLLRAGQDLNIRYLQLYRRNIFLKEKLDSGMQNHASSSSPESVYRGKILEINKFYNYEYEILPLWYKRFGHIIKVMMGKRTFRSLYDDNVKKYNT